MNNCRLNCLSTSSVCEEYFEFDPNIHGTSDLRCDLSPAEWGALQENGWFDPKVERVAAPFFSPISPEISTRISDGDDALDYLDRLSNGRLEEINKLLEDSTQEVITCTEAVQRLLLTPSDSELSPSP